MQKHFNDKRIAFLANGVRTIGPLDAKTKNRKQKKDLDLNPKPCTNNNSNKSHSEI